MQQSIICEKCSSENEIGMNFCIRCGARLGTVCPNCGGIVPPDSRYCPGCASQIGIGRVGKYQHIVEGTDHNIVCSRCGTSNSSGRRFCAECGNHLVIPCPNCKNINVLPSGYCPDCGNIIEIKKKQ
jgi:RNA polymerase subunit RPABC4/transcription elongation factor Spt4